MVIFSGFLMAWCRFFFQGGRCATPPAEDVGVRTCACPCHRSGSNVVLGFVPRAPAEGIGKVGVIRAVIEHFVVSFVHGSLLSVWESAESSEISQRVSVIYGAGYE